MILGIIFSSLYSIVRGIKLYNGTWLLLMKSSTVLFIHPVLMRRKLAVEMVVDEMALLPYDHRFGFTTVVTARLLMKLIMTAAARRHRRHSIGIVVVVQVEHGRGRRRANFRVTFFYIHFDARALVGSRYVPDYGLL